MSIRVGSPDSPVLPGTPVPGKPGKYYEKGQFAPSLDELATSTFAEADKAGLISSDLPIFDEQGNVSPEKIETWNPKENLPGINVSSQVSNFSMAVLLTVNSMFPEILTTLGVSSILSGEELEAQEGKKSILGEALITERTVPRQRAFATSIYIYDRYYQYISTPIVAEIPGRTKGISVSTFATLKILGHILFNKLNHEGQIEFIGRYLTAAGWSKTPDNSKRGEFMGKKNLGAYYRKNDTPITSEISRYSPIDDFADTFAHYLVHRSYLSSIAPEKLKVLEDINEHYGLV